MEHARLFLEHPLLGENLLKITKELLNANTSNPTEIVGSIDELKLKSCMTLFAKVNSEIKLFDEVISKFYDGKPDERTVELLKLVSLCKISARAEMESFLNWNEVFT